MTKRLDKFLCDNLGLTRNDAKKEISAGSVKVNGETIKKPETKITENDEVTYKSQIIKKIGFVYIALNKPAGVISATEDGKCKTVIDLVYENEEFKGMLPKNGLFPIGRLDKDTEGLIVITNDGMLSHNLLSPKKHVEKEYIAKCEGHILSDACARFAIGIQVGTEYKAMPAKLTVLSEKENENGNEYEYDLDIVLTEGKFHEVKRMCHEVGVEVTYLKRVRFGKLLISDLKPGEMKFIRKEDI